MTYNRKLIRYLLNGWGVDRAAKELIEEARSKLDEYKKDIHDQASSLELIWASLTKPEGTVDRILAEQLIKQIRMDYPEEAAKADKDLKRSKEWPYPPLKPPAEEGSQIPW